MSRCRPVLFLLAALLVAAAPAAAQEEQAAPSAKAAAQEAPPARYDTDLLSKGFHRQKRQALLDALPQDAVAVLFSAPQRTRANDIRFEYRQNSDLYYLTGTTEAGSVLMLAPAGIEVDGQTVHELLFVPPRTQYSDVWLGRRLGPARAERKLGVEEAVSNERFQEILAQVAGGDRRFFHLPLPFGVEEDSELSSQLARFRQKARLTPSADSPLVREALKHMRAVDDPEGFANLQEQFRRRLTADAFEGDLLQEAYRQFTQAESLEEWTQWRAENLRTGHADGQTLRRLLTEMRVRKSEEELRLMRRAIDITAEAQRQAMRSIAPGMFEYEIEALVEYVFKKNGAEYTGFPSIIGSGENATVLHYESNRRQMQAGDMVVMDIGAEYHGYSADVTRSVPVDGDFSEEERAVYELVLKAQKAGIQAARAGNNFRDPGQVARRVIGEGLVELGLTDDPGEVRRFFMHGTSHYLGLYTHDVGTGGPLTPGTVLTVEPGIYIRPSDDVPERWHNIGVRIEDDILVTEDGPVNLSEGAPREIDAIEALMRKPSMVSSRATGR